MLGNQLGNSKPPYRLIRTAVISRILVLALIVLWRSVRFPYDTSATLNPPCLTAKESNTTVGSIANNPHSKLLKKVGSAVEESVVWDSVYYVRIAECGYEYEQTYAFLPFLPICMKILTVTVFSPLIPLIGNRAVLAFSGYVLNNVSFVIAAVFLYKLTIYALHDPKIALWATQFFCFNPASIFYSSIYSESLFSLLSFSGIYYFLLGHNWKAVLLFALSSSVRSNGVLHTGFFLFQAMHHCYDAFFQKKNTLLALQVMLGSCLQSVCVFVPFVTFQFYGFSNICYDDSLFKEVRPWCNGRVPYLYGFIQSYYWDVGFLRYFQLKQLPNFFLASPMLLLGIFTIIFYCKKNHKVILTLGFQASNLEKMSAAVVYFIEAKNQNKDVTMPKLDFSKPIKSSSLGSSGEGIIRNRGKEATVKDRVRSTDTVSSSQHSQLVSSAIVVPFLVQLAFMIFVASCIMHVQVATRFLSVSPPIYWFAATLKRQSANYNIVYVIWATFFSYLFMGSLLFSNFYPFT